MTSAILTKRVPFYRCIKCGYEWQGRKPTLPVVCPKCKRPSWKGGK